MTPRWTWLPRPAGIAAESLARAWLAPLLGCTADALAIGRDGHGRPRLGEPFSDWDVNWSHSGAGLLVALARRQRVGIDLEWLRPRPAALQLARRFFAAREAQWLASLAASGREHAFLRLWCAKEAVLKAHGRGLAFGLDRLVFTCVDGRLQLSDCDPALGPASHWRLLELAPAPGYLGAMAWCDGVVGGDNSRP
jgi:4'-phosphopantetheinyl transferase